MRYSKLLLAVLAAAMLLGALVASASARNLSNSTTAIGATWTALSFTGGFGTVDCEVILSGTVPRTIAKTVNGPVGAITAANSPACRRSFGMTILRETLPWSLTYRGFTGTLPNIGTISTNLIGFSFRWREPSIGATCLARSSAASPSILTYNREAAGRITSVEASGSIPCEGAIRVTGGISGRSSSVSALTITLI